jgi:hypothetical protein
MLATCTAGGHGADVAATGLDATPVAAIAGIPALRAPADAVPWLDADAISAFAHFGPTGLATEDGPPMITAIATSQDADELVAELAASG